jgi:outer membrane protein TolC
MKRYFFTLLVMVSWLANAQNNDTISLEWCNNRVKETYPLARQRALMNQSSELRMKNFNTNILPQFYLNGQMSYQSDVTELPVKTPLFSIPSMDKDMYKVSLDVSQVIFDGKMTRGQENLEIAGLEADQKNLEAELYKLKERLHQIYFSILIQQENEKILILLQENLKSKLLQVESGVRNGMVLESNADILRAELLKVDEQILDVQENRKSQLSVLGIFIDKPLPAKTNLKLPEIQINTGSNLKQRIEYAAFDLQKKRLEISKDLVNSRNLPRVSAFGQLGYGRPGLNMLKNEFASFYMVGARLNWNIWNWNQVKNEQKLTDIQQDMIEVQKETFDRNLQMTLKRNVDEIQKLEALIRKDEEIINRREKVSKTLSSQLDNGVITATEYLSEYNNEIQARINLQSHKVLLAKAKADYLTSLGSF